MENNVEFSPSPKLGHLQLSMDRKRATITLLLSFEHRYWLLMGIVWVNQVFISGGVTSSLFTKPHTWALGQANSAWFPTHISTQQHCSFSVALIMTYWQNWKNCSQQRHPGTNVTVKIFGLRVTWCWVKVKKRNCIPLFLVQVICWKPCFLKVNIGIILTGKRNDWLCHLKSNDSGMGFFNCPTQLFSLLLTVFHSVLTKVQLEKKSSPSRTVPWNASMVCGMCFQEAHTDTYAGLCFCGCVCHGNHI